MTKPGTIMLLEDDQDIRETVLESLEEQGYRTIGAETGAVALDLLRTGGIRPDVILLDLRMPGMSGAEFRTEQLHDPALADIPVVIVSADARVEEQCAELQAAGYLKKPVKLRSLLDVAERFSSEA